MGPGSGAEDDLALGCDATLVVGDLDDAGLDVGVLDALLDFTDVEGGDGVGGGFPEDTGDVTPGAGGGDDVDAGAPGDVFQHADVTAKVNSSDVDDGIDAFGFGGGEVPDAPLNDRVSGDEFGVDLLDAGGGDEDVAHGRG